SNRLCALDLARRRLVRPAEAFSYTANWRAGADVRPAPVEAGPDGKLCIALPRISAAPTVPNDAAGRYVTVTIANGASRYPLRAYLYELGDAGYRLAGLERREEP